MMPMSIVPVSSLADKSLGQKLAAARGDDTSRELVESSLLHELLVFQYSCLN